MPLPMVHLSVAVLLGERRSTFPSSDFLLGSIAPDAIHMRPNTTRDDKNATHLLTTPDTPEHDAVRNLLDQPNPSTFTRAYAAHLLTDRLWLSEVFYKFRDSAPTEPNSAEERTLYYTETDQVDINLYHRTPWRPEVWRCLEVAQAPNFPPLLTAEEIYGWADRTLRWYEDPAKNPGVTPQYLTDSLVADFIIQSADDIQHWFDAWGVDSAV